MLSARVAETVVRRRKALGVTREQLAAKCAALGDDKLTIAALESIETGRNDKQGRRRRRISVDELLILARALNVPPVALLFPLDAADSEPLPGTHAQPWEATAWVTGEQPPPAPFAHDGQEECDRWRSATEPLRLYRDHARKLDGWETSTKRAERSEVEALEARTDTETTLHTTIADEQRKQANYFAASLAVPRDRLRALGCTPPELPEALAYLDLPPGESMPAIHRSLFDGLEGQ